MVIQEFKDKGTDDRDLLSQREKEVIKEIRERSQLPGNGRQVRYQHADCPYTHQEYLQKTSR